MTTVVLGNRHAVHSLDDGETRVPMPKGKRATVIELDDELTPGQVLLAIAHPEGVWANHATDGSTPAWVASDDEAVAIVLAHHFGAKGQPLEVRELLDPYDPATAKPKRRGGGSAAGAALAPMLTVVILGAMLLKATPWLRTNGGADFQATQMAGSASASAVAKWMALTANATAESATDTTLTAEIATAGGGLIRQSATYAHTTGATSYTLTGTFTANGSDALPVTIAKMAVFTASASGTMVFEKLLTTTATLSLSGDSLVVTETVSI
jgi:hypothetical protein